MDVDDETLTDEFEGFGVSISDSSVLENCKYGLVH